MPPKDTIFLHIGMHKTASTSIQVSLRQLADGTTRYARLGAPNHSVALLRMFDDALVAKARARAAEDDDGGAGARDRVAAALEDSLQSPERNLILSGEGLTRMSPEGIARMQAYLAPRCREIRVLAYVRDPAGFAPSAWQQRIKGGLPDFRVPTPNYRARFEGFIDVFGRAAVEFVRFAPKSFRNGCIITDFCDRVGVDVSQIERHHVGSSMSGEAAALLMLWNRQQKRVTPRTRAASTSLQAVLKEAFPGKFSFSPELIAAHLDQADCDWMEAQAGFALADPANPAASGAVIGGEDDLMALARGAVPRLEALLDGRGIAAPAEATPEALIGALSAGLPTSRAATRAAKASRRRVSG
ncbi:hypothetical protein LCL97_21625 [Seohaeicola saemankumensis]|nr:hypothetical protein [Seohaeicola saemankumensis]MCA0873439.1 hypothetical protein [Seohaeicola saemankumensis]